MTELYEKSLRKLELDRVLEQLAAYANSDEAKARCLALEPQTDVDEIRVLQEQTGAACRLICQELPLSGKSPPHLSDSSHPPGLQFFWHSCRLLPLTADSFFA